MNDLGRFTSGLSEVVSMAGGGADLDGLLNTALAALSPVIQHDLAAYLESGNGRLSVRAAHGPHASKGVVGHELDLASHPKLRKVLQTRLPALMAEHDHRGEGDPYDGVLDYPAGHSCMVVPVFAGDQTFGVLTFDCQECGVYSQELVRLAGIYGQLIGLAIASSKQNEKLKSAQQRLRAYNQVLEKQVRGDQSAIALLQQTSGPAMSGLLKMAESVAASGAPVLISGETGTGKEVLSRAIHEWSGRAPKPFIQINCAALPENLIESELFGHVRGAFTGATKDRPGRFQIANGGTLLLDEIGDMPLEAQAKLLRVLQEGTLQPVGSDRTLEVDVRIIAATHRPLDALVAANRFREDLYYRLSVLPLRIPPLRERQVALPMLAGAILKRLAQRYGKAVPEISDKSLARFAEYSWPGNVRELVNTLERALILHQSGPLEAGPSAIANPAPRAPASRPPKGAADGALTPAGESHQEMERNYFRRLLQRTEGKVYGDKGAAAIAQMAPSTLQSRLKKLGLTPADYR